MIIFELLVLDGAETAMTTAALFSAADAIAEFIEYEAVVVLVVFAADLPTSLPTPQGILAPSG